MGVPQNGWFIINGKPVNLTKMDDLGVPPFMETSISFPMQWCYELVSSLIIIHFM